MTAPSSDSAPSPSPIRFWFVIGGVIILAIAGSWALQSSLNRFEDNTRKPLPVLREVREPFSASERLGSTKQFKDLQGKVVVAAYAYSRCPHGCAGVAAKMLDVRNAFKDNDQLQLVSVAAWPAIDSPEVLKTYAEAIGVSESDHWWWMTTDRDKAWEFMTNSLGFEPSIAVPESQRLNPEDWVEHDLRAVLVDKNQRVRGYYALLHPQEEIAALAEQKLLRDIQTLLAE